jgi:hypothetical protein
VNASDSSGSVYVTLLYAQPGSLKYAGKAMNFVSGTLYQTTVTNPGTWSQGSMTYYVEATDPSSNLSRLPLKGTQSVSVVACTG